MSTARTIFRTLSTATAVTSLLLVAAPSAQATGLGVGSYQGCVKSTAREADVAATLARCVTAVMSVRVVQGTNNVRYIEFSCSGVAVGDGASVTIETCAVGGVSAIDVPHTAPGPVNTQVGVTVASAGDAVTACVGVVAEWVLTPDDARADGCSGLLLNLAT